MLWSLLLLCCPFYGVNADVVAHSLLLIVGDVTDTTARVLCDALQPSLRHWPLPVVLRTAAGEEVARQSVTPADGPVVVWFQGLRPFTQFEVSFGEGLLDVVEMARFQTFRPPGSSQPLRLLALSCDRWLEDHDDSV
eukprot:EG_transcript_43342